MRWDAYDWTVRMKICWLEFSCENPWWTLKAKFSEVKSKEARLSIIRISDFCKLLCVKLKWKQGNLWVTELRILQYYLGLQGTLLLVLSGCVTKLISCWYNALDWNNRSDICCWGGFGWGTNVEYMWRMLNLFPKWKMNLCMWSLSFFFLFAKSSIFLFINCNIIFIQYADSCFNYHIVFGRKECHCMLFLTPDNDFAGQDQVTP